MKSIKVKSYNKLIENIITEDGIKLDGNVSDFKGKLKKRITDAIRLAKECRVAAEKARDDGNDADADWLEQRAEDYELAAENWNQDILDDENDKDSSTDSKQNKTNKEPSQAEAAQDAANAANRAAVAAQDAADNAQKNVDKLADAGQDTSAAKAVANVAKEKANEANKAAQEAQDHADKARQAEAAGDTEKAKSEAQAAKDAKDAAKQAANEAIEAAKSASQTTASERAQDAVDAAEEAARKAEANANTAQKAADDLKAGGKDASEAQAKADDLKDKAKEAKKAAEEAKQHAEKAKEAEKSGDTNTANSEADKAEAAADSAKQSAETDTDNNNDDSSDATSNGSGGGSSKGSSKSSGEGGGEGGDSDDEDDDPVKDLFADDEDIPGLPGGGGGGFGKDPRDPTIDEIIKQLKKLDGDAKRGAISGLSDLINKNKNESLTEAFNKGIREFSDEEWDSLNNETIDRINKIKKITTINDIEGKKAEVKSWAENQVARQELEDEESQNAQHDILQRRAKEQELDKYNHLDGIKDFELDFEGCIRDQVEMVMQDYLTYDEINPEYELEDVIMKAEVQRMIPDDAVPTIAVFFDKSGSCKYAIPALNRAIATVKQKYVDTGLCKLDLYYFADWVSTNADARVGGSTEAWPEIIDTIKRGDYKNVVVMSDDDIGHQNNNGESYTVEGCVWWLWVNGNRAPKCVKELHGMQHNFEGIIRG